MYQITESDRKILKAARKRLIRLYKAKGCTEGLCFAIKKVMPKVDRTDLAYAIRHSVRTQGYVSIWLTQEHPLFWKQLRTVYPSLGEAMTVYRTAWIDHILKTGRI